MKYKPIRGLELSALAAIKYQTTSQEHNILDDANQAIAYRTGMDDATIRDANDLLYKDPDYPYALPISILPDGGISSASRLQDGRLGLPCHRQLEQGMGCR